VFFKAHPTNAAARLPTAPRRPRYSLINYIHSSTILLPTAPPSVTHFLYAGRTADQTTGQTTGQIAGAAAPPSMMPPLPPSPPSRGRVLIVGPRPRCCRARSSASGRRRGGPSSSPWARRWWSRSAQAQTRRKNQL
jgi:hypothetical protein